MERGRPADTCGYDGKGKTCHRFFLSSKDELAWSDDCFAARRDPRAGAVDTNAAVAVEVTRSRRPRPVFLGTFYKCSHKRTSRRRCREADPLSLP